MRLALLFWLFIWPLHAAELLIKHKILKQNTVCFHLSGEFTKKYLKQPFRLSYPPTVNLEVLPSSIVDIPLITYVIAVIWHSGKEYTIHEMDEDLYYSLIKIKKFFKRFFYNTSWEGELIPERLVKNTLPGGSARTATLFTGGVDSTATVFTHFDDDLILISFNNPHKTATEFARAYNLDFHKIYMNYDVCLKLTSLDKASSDISKWFWDTSMGLSWVGAAAPFLYAMGIPLLYVPSGFTWRSFLFSDGQTLRQPACPLIDENLSPAGLRVEHDSFTMTRTEKLKFISSFCAINNIPKPQLIVCNHHAKADVSYTSCHRCVKCLLTMLDILIIGENLHEYGFTLSEQEFISQIQTYIANRIIKRGGTYAACRDSQTYLKHHIQTLPQTRREFYNWFMTLDLYSMLEKSSHRPLRTIPFDWHDYGDLYPRAKYFND